MLFFKIRIPLYKISLLLRKECLFSLDTSLNPHQEDTPLPNTNIFHPKTIKFFKKLHNL